MIPDPVPATNEEGMGKVNSHISRYVAVAMAAIGLGSCSGFQPGSFADLTFWENSPLFIDNSAAELGLGEMAKGNYGLAESHYAKALKKDPKDVDALLGLGILYQNTGQTIKAREMYEAILAVRPDHTKQMVVWNNFRPRPVSEIASVNLSLIDSGGVLTGLGGPAGQPPSQQNLSVAPGAPLASNGIGGAPTGSAMMGRPAAAWSPPAPAASPAQPVTQAYMPGTPGTAQGIQGAMMPRFADADANIVSRFKTLVALRDQGLITPEEFRIRRQANVGALLPLTSPPPAAGLDRPVPTTEQISGRLRAIGRALEMRAITISQHGAERSMILDAMMPSAPVVVANPAVPPSGLMEAADLVRRLEQLNATGLITTDEYTKERGAVEGAMQPAPPRPSAAVMKTLAPTEGTAEMKPMGPQPGVHLASYRSRKAADRGWAQLRRAHRNLLGNFNSEITEVNLGPGKGIYFRLKVGPVPDHAAAADLCRQLKKRRQFCEPTIVGAG